jgi:hypothetical protein
MSDKGFPKPVAHCADGFETALRVLRWAEHLSDKPSASAIQDRWGVSRATAYRWRAALSVALTENWKPKLAQ